MLIKACKAGLTCETGYQLPLLLAGDELRSFLSLRPTSKCGQPESGASSRVIK